MNSLAQLGYWFLPEALVPSVVALLAPIGVFLWLLGARRWAFSLLMTVLGLALLPALLAPVLAELLAAVPMWLVVLSALALGSYLLRLVLSLFLGKEGAGTLLAMLVAGGLRGLHHVPRGLRRGLRGLGALVQSPTLGRRILGLVLCALLALAAGLLTAPSEAPAPDAPPALVRVLDAVLALGAP